MNVPGSNEKHKRRSGNKGRKTQVRGAEQRKCASLTRQSRLSLFVRPFLGILHPLQLQHPRQPNSYPSSVHSCLRAIPCRLHEREGRGMDKQRNKKKMKRRDAAANAAKARMPEAVAPAAAAAATMRPPSKASSPRMSTPQIYLLQVCMPFSLLPPLFLSTLPRRWNLLLSTLPHRCLSCNSKSRLFHFHNKGRSRCNRRREE
jgi:hypothetical protein